MEGMVFAAKSGLPALIAKYGIGWWLLIPAGMLLALTIYTVKKDARDERAESDND